MPISCELQKITATDKYTDLGAQTQESMDEWEGGIHVTGGV
jgi:hypothetical protein